MIGWLATGVRYRIAALWILVSVLVVSVLAVPIKVTIDGIVYLDSAKALFSPDFARVYAYFREPGYPFMLWALQFVGNDGMNILVVQALFLGLSVLIAAYCLFRVLGRPGFTRGQLLVVLALALNPMYLIYAGLVLQQALFAFQLALFTLGVCWALVRPTWLRRWVLLAGALITYVLAIWTSVGWIYLALIPVVLTVILLYRQFAMELFRRARSLAVRIAVVACVVLVSGLLTFAVHEGAVAVYSGWQAIKAPYEASAKIPGAVIEPLSSVPPIPTVGQMVNRLLALVHIGTVVGYPHENDLFLAEQMVLTRPQGQWDTAWVSPPYSTYSVGYIALPSASWPVHFAYSVAARAAPAVYTASFVGFMLFLLAAFVRRRWKALIILAVPAAFIFVYAASNAPIDRYGIPVYPWTAAACALLFGWAWELFRYIRRRKAVRPYGEETIPVPSEL